MINGHRIKQARELCGFNQKELARRTGLSQPTIAQFELGLREPTEETLKVLAFQLGFRPGFFRDPDAPDFPLGSHLLYRTRTGLTKTEKVRAHRFAETVFQAIERLRKSLDLIKPTIPQVREESAQAARITRAALGQRPDTPIGNLVRIAEHAGVFVIPVPLNIEDPDAFSTWAGLESATPVIALLSGRPGDRVRMTVAHELGHLVLHRPLRITVKEAEREAYEFAAELLMPAQAILPELHETDSIEDYARLKTRWRVAIQALIRRAHDLGVISDNRYKSLFQRLSALGMRKKEQPVLPEERPRLLRKMVEIQFGSPIDYSRMAAVLSWRESFCREVINAHSGPSGEPSETGGGSMIPFPGPRP